MTLYLHYLNVGLSNFLKISWKLIFHLFDLLIGIQK